MRMDLRRPDTSCGARGKRALEIQLGLYARQGHSVHNMSRADLKQSCVVQVVY